MDNLTESLFLTSTVANPTVNANSTSSTVSVASLVEKWTVPAICTLGILGNTLSAVIFLRRSLRLYSSSLYLVMRSISDNGFLATLLAIWASSVFELHLSRIPGLCQTLIFLTYVFGCLSVWLVVFLTAENYIRICRPFMVQRLCKTQYAKLAMIVLFVLVICFYNFPLWTTTSQCVPYATFYDFLQIMVYADTILTLVLPAVIMSVLMVAMATTSISTCQRRRRQSNVSATSYKSPLTKVTNMLLAVTLIFFTLNLPSHAVRMGLMISTFVEREQITPTQPTDITMQSISQMLYYLSMSINIFIYYLFGRRFRKTFKELFTSSSVKTLVQTDKRHDTLPLVVSNSELSLRAMTRKNGISLHPGELMSLREMQICKL